MTPLLRPRYVAVLGVLSFGCDPSPATTSPQSTGAGGKSDSFEDDDRTTVANSPDERAIMWAASVAIVTTKLRSGDVGGLETLAERFNLCTDQPFRDDPFLGHCTAFLVAPDIVATAAHCLEQHDCTRTDVLFGFSDVGVNEDPDELDPEHVYQCREVFMNANDDLALVQLDREVFDRSPLALGVPVQGRAVALVGHGLGGRATADISGVIERTRDRAIRTTLDTFSGHSGSPIFDLETGRVVAVHTAGTGGFNVVERDEACGRYEVCNRDVLSCLALGYDVAGLPFDDVP